MIGAVLLGLACSPSPPPPDVPEVLIISVDTLRVDRLGFNGHQAAQTPKLNGMASVGRVFDQAITPLPRTTPALASLMTGLSPEHHGSREVGTPMTATTTLATVLQEAGYRTVAVSAMAVAGPEQGLDRGFETFELQHDASAATITNLALEHVAGAPTQPLLLWVHYADPHFPYEPAKEGPLHPEAPACRALMNAVMSGGGKRAAMFADREGMASAALADCQKLYDAEIAAVDGFTRRHDVADARQ